MKIIAYIKNDFDEKFGVPRQAGLIEEIESSIVFEPEYAVPEAFRGLEEYSHIWLLWQFSESTDMPWSPTVRPPRLGGNVRKGVFATRSPHRPNPIGLSCVRLTGIDTSAPDRAILRVAGADLKNGTPIYDIKPYLPYTDIKTDASNGFADTQTQGRYEVIIPGDAAAVFPAEKLPQLRAVLSLDPRPQYKGDDGERIYGIKFAGFNVKFTVENGRVTVTAVEKPE